MYGMVVKVRLSPLATTTYQLSTIKQQLHWSKVSIDRVPVPVRGTQTGDRQVHGENKGKKYIQFNSITPIAL